MIDRRLLRFHAPTCREALQMLEGIAMNCEFAGADSALVEEARQILMGSAPLFEIRREAGIAMTSQVHMRECIGDRIMLVPNARLNDLLERAAIARIRARYSANRSTLTLPQADGSFPRAGRNPEAQGGRPLDAQDSPGGPTT